MANDQYDHLLYNLTKQTNYMTEKIKLNCLKL